MKRIFFLAIASAIFFSGCSKHVENTPAPPPPPPPPPPPINYLVASAGLDTTICMPYGGMGNIFRGRLDGSASHDDSGKIVSYAWSEILGTPPNTSSEIIGEGDFPDSSIIYSGDSAEITFPLINGGTHYFMLKVRDDHGRVDSSIARINVIQYFNAEYDGISWDSTTGALRTISVKFKPGLIESWPDFTGLDTGLSGVYLSNFNGECVDTVNQEKLPYVPYDSIQLTDKLLFYSLISIPQTIIDNGRLYPEIYAKTNSGIDFNQKVSIGFIEAYPPYWDYKISSKKLIRRTGPN